MTIREFIKNYDGDVDVFVDGEGCIAYCGTQLTPEGEEAFKDVLDLEMTGDCVLGSDEECSRAWEFFVSAAGYCPESDYDKWFFDE